MVREGSVADPIIVGTDGSPQSGKAVAWAANLATTLGTELLVVHVFEVDPAKLPGGYTVLSQEGLTQLRTKSRDHLESECSADARKANIRFRTLLLDGNAAAALMELAERENAGLIVVGNRGRGGFAELLLGSVGHHLVQHSPIPVTIVPSR